MNQDDEVLAVRAAELYYQDDKNQAEIASSLGITRWKVGRLLAQAKSEGIVRIEISHPKARRLPLERQLRDTLGLRDAVVVPSESAERPYGADRVALAAAEYLTTLRPVPKLLGVSWGRTMQSVANALPEHWAKGVEVVQVNGGVTVNRQSGMASATALTIAQKADGVATLLPSPAIVEHAATKRAIEQDRAVAGILEKARSTSALIFSAGTVDMDSVLVTSGYLGGPEVRSLREKGAVGDVLGRYVDTDGHIVDPALDERTIGLSLDDLRTARLAIAVISGQAKWPVCRAIVQNRYCSVLVTDEDCAQFLLEGRT